jgi:AraC family transcriptional regulator
LCLFHVLYTFAAGGKAMEQAVEHAMARVIDTMRENLGEELTIDDMARTALFSKFYFCRIFRQATGVSPARFLSALRLQEAKRLLLTTEWSVADISNRVGYSSVGTFSSRFKQCVCVSPTTYRQYGGFPPQVRADTHRVSAGTPCARVQGRILAPPNVGINLVFAGLFPGRVPQGAPVRCAILTAPGPYMLSEVPDGTWHLLAQAYTPGGQDPYDQPAQGGEVPIVGAYGPITIRRRRDVHAVDLQLRPMCSLDPPVLLALPDLRESGLVATAS